MKKTKYYIEDDFLPAFVSHPGEILKEELAERGITQQKFSEMIKRPLKTVSLIINGKKSITADTAYDLEKAFGVSADFWLKMQNDYDLYICRKKRETNKKRASDQTISSVPILGFANCGEANSFAEENNIGYIRYPVKKSDIKKIFALKTVGNSMDRANINGKSINDGEIVLIKKENREPTNGEYILSIIDKKANIKKFFRDKKNKQILLLSESSEDIDPITISKNDDYILGGFVLDVVNA